MAIKLTQTEKDQTYFCTFTCLDWIHLFETVDLYDEIYKWSMSSIVSRLGDDTNKGRMNP